MDNVLVMPGARAFQLPYSHSYCPTPMSMSVSNAFPYLQKSLSMTWDGHKKRGMEQKQKHITVMCHIGDIPARDRKIDFGRNKGKMMGTLPSRYLRWMVKNTYPDAQWSAMAEEVLEDPVYRDRMEWEKLDEAMKGSGYFPTKTSSIPNTPDLYRICARFGFDPWGNWSSIDYNLLGTSKGKRIPRIKDNPQHEYMLNLVMQKKGLMPTSLSESLLSENAEVKPMLKRGLIATSLSENLVSENAEAKLDYKRNDNSSKGLKSEIEMRRERRERQRLRRGPTKTQLKQQPRHGRLFPGREALLRRISDAESRD